MMMTGILILYVTRGTKLPKFGGVFGGGNPLFVLPLSPSQTSLPFFICLSILEHFCAQMLLLESSMDMLLTSL
jgi:hypothetical protein